tara:strand:- start:52304 stop:53914 length:1611 start_codon:yes stop_codon:yes gene_type:complete
MKDIKLTRKATVGGRITAAVLDGKTGEVIREYAPQKNLVLDSGLNFFFISGTGDMWSSVNEAHGGTGTTPNDDDMTGTWEQSGTTVTRSTGTGAFVIGDVSKRIKFADGKRGRITAYTSGTEVEVDTSQTATAQQLQIYHTDQTALVTEDGSTTTLAVTAGSSSNVQETLANTCVDKKTWIFPIRVGSISYTEVGFSGGSDLFSRILLDTPIAVDIGQQLRLAYELTQTDSHGIVSVDETLTITGWPRPYNITSIASTGSDFTVTTDEDHHYLASGEITIGGALPTKVTIIGITSTGADFTVNATAHGHLAADSIDIEDCSVGAYNGTWTVASVGDVDNYTVTSAANPGVASDGTTRASVPGSWYNGTWTVASVTATTIVITSGINPIAAGGDGTVVNDLAVGVIHPTHGFRSQQSNLGSSGNDNYLFEGLDLSCSLRQVGSTLAFTTFPEGNTIGGTITSDDTATKDGTAGKCTNVCIFSIDQANFEDIGQLLLSYGSGTRRYAQVICNFEQPQRKDSGYQLTITTVRQILQELA